MINLRQKMMAKISLISLAILVIASLVLFNLDRDPSFEKVSKSNAITSSFVASRPPSDKLNPVVENSISCQERVDNGAIFKKEIFSGDQIKRKVEEKKEMGYRDPAQLILAAEEGSETSAIALFEIATICPNFRRSAEQGWIREEQKICDILATKSVDQPLDLLQAAIDRNSNYAKLAYAENSLAYIDLLKQEKSRDSISIADAVTKKSQQYGKEAAQSGLEEAYNFMVRAHYTGQLGKRDPTLAYAYMLPLLERKSEHGQIAFAQKLQKELSPKQLNKAWEEAYGCSARVNASQNPFLF